MRVLFAAHPDPDWGEILVYEGLCELLGTENVTEMPYKYLYHGQAERLENPTLKEFFTELPHEGLTQRMLQGDYFALPNGFSNPQPPVIEIPEEVGKRDQEVLAHLSEFDVLICSIRPVAIWMGLKVQEQVRDIPTVIIDYDDSYEIQVRHIERLGAGLYFNSTLVTVAQGGDYNETIHKDVVGACFPSPTLGSKSAERLCIDDSWEKKDIELQIRLGMTNQKRCYAYMGAHTLKEMGYRVAMGELDFTLDIKTADWQFFVTQEATLSWADWLRETARSKISVVVGGNGLGISLKHFEIPAFRTMMLCERPIAIHPHPFEDGKHCVFFDVYKPEELVEKARYYLAHDDECKQIADAGHEHLVKYHTKKISAERMIERIKQRFNIS